LNIPGVTDGAAARLEATGPCAGSAANASLIASAPLRAANLGAGLITGSS